MAQTYDFDGQLQVFLTTSETLLYEWSDDLGAAPTIAVELAAIIKATGGATGTFRVRIGGTIGAVDGTVAATISTTSASFVQLNNVAASVANTGGLGLVKLTGQCSSSAQLADVKGAMITIDRSGNDGTPPVIQNVTPTPGLFPGTYQQAIQTPIQFDVIDVSPGLRLTVVTMQYAGDTAKLVVHDGTRFIGQFASSTSVRTAITNGYHYTVLPIGGWPANIDQLWVYPVDQSGNLEGGLPP